MFLFQKKENTRGRWCVGKRWLALLNQRAFLCFLWPLTNFYFCYLFVIVYTKCAFGSDGKREVWQSIWPGFEPQVFSNFHVIFLLTITCSFAHWSPWYISSSGQPRVCLRQSKGAKLMNTINSGQRCYTLPGKSNGPMSYWAWISKAYLHIGAWTPPGLQISTFSLYFIFNYCFICFIVLI